MQKICIISVPRTGTNHLGNVLNSIHRMKNHFELFHPGAVYTLDPGEVKFLNSKMGKNFKKFDDPALVEWARGNPLQLLDYLGDYWGKDNDFLSFKIFVYHLQMEQIENMIKRKDIKFLLITRNLLDIYISLQKAQKTDKYKSVNTSDIKVDLDFRSYLNWSSNIISWYDNVEKLLEKHGKPFARLRYEEDIDVPEKKLIRIFRERMLKQGLDLSVGEIKQGLSKQDRKTNYADKVSNWDEFCTKINESGFIPPAG